MPRVYIRSITRSTMYQKVNFFSRNWRMENSSVACGFSSIKIYYSDYSKRFMSHNLFSSKFDFEMLKNKHIYISFFLRSLCCLMLYLVIANVYTAKLRYKVNNYITFIYF